MKKYFFWQFIFLFVMTHTFLISCSQRAENAGETIVETNESQPTAQTVSVEQKGGLAVGDKAPDFRLKNVDGKMVGLSDYQDAKGFIITFTCNTCPYANAYEERLIELHRKYAPQGYPLIAVQPNDPAVKKGDSFEKMKERAADKAYPFPYLMDDGSVVSVFGATKTPEIYLLDKSRVVRYTGAIDDNYADPEAVKIKYVEDAISAMQSGKEPSPAFTKAIGCGIKAKQI